MAPGFHVFSKFVKLRRGQLQLSLDALNAYNSNTYWAMTFAAKAVANEAAVSAMKRNFMVSTFR